MTYKDFLELCRLLSYEWKGCFTEYENREHAQELFEAYNEEKQTGKENDLITAYLENIEEDVENVGVERLDSIERRVYIAFKNLRKPNFILK